MRKCALDKKIGVQYVRKKLKIPCVDHDHTTKKVRGLLCRHCNLLLGYCEENVLVLQRAINYLNSNVL
jgi:hypothetical protein